MIGDTLTIEIGKRNPAIDIGPLDQGGTRRATGCEAISCPGVL